MGGEKDGVIGGEVFPRTISQPPAYVYWTALTKWGLIGTRPDGRPWNRSEMAKLLREAQRYVEEANQKRLANSALGRIASIGAKVDERQAS